MAMALGVALVAALAPSAGGAPATAVGELELVEGQGIGDLLTLGMTRQQVVAVASEGPCVDTRTCVIHLSSDTGAVFVTFAAERVESIDVLQTNAETKWATTAGATDDMTLEEVAALYADDGAVVGHEEVVVASRGYTFERDVSCYVTFCSVTVFHHLYAAEGDGAPAHFEGSIVVANPSRKATTADVRIRVDAPDGSVTATTLRLRIPGRGSVAVDPADLLPLDGPTGTYAYTAEVLGKRDRVTSTSTGTFRLVG